MNGLHPAQNRGLRELHAAAHQIADHWSSLRGRLAGTGDVAAVLDRGAVAARRLLAELGPVTASYGLYGGPAALSLGGSLARTRGAVGDRLLERNQALRFAVLDLQHVVTLLGYQAALASSAQDARLASFCAGWVEELSPIEAAARAAAIRMGEDPDAAVAPADGSVLGRAGHALAYRVGAVGEWVDRRTARG
jgi:hypothetical protein